MLKATQDFLFFFANSVICAFGHILGKFLLLRKKKRTNCRDRVEHTEASGSFIFLIKSKNVKTKKKCFKDTSKMYKIIILSE